MVIRVGFSLLLLPFVDLFNIEGLADNINQRPLI